MTTTAREATARVVAAVLVCAMAVLGATVARFVAQAAIHHVTN